ncbi:CLUMA_CG007819, isoform A [Clunio marinus]|uniref:CLUMA_CG007819, isoform A n=1 Tax=Clunio marinus TaxID=568069 RepID=A0A1J1I1V4_9DIPT|nr:CLUMA_CG007819, isoform A [Clunio marinus]
MYNGSDGPSSFSLYVLNPPAQTPSTSSVKVFEAPQQDLSIFMILWEMLGSSKHGVRCNYT